MTGHATGRRWHVVRQYTHRTETYLCAHRWEMTADLCAIRRAAGREHRTQTGVHYAVRPVTP